MGSVAALPSVQLGVQLQGSVPDIGASWAAKLMVADKDQVDPSRLGSRYEQMQSGLDTQGLDLAAIEAQRQYYGGLAAGQNAFPLAYNNFPVPLEAGAVRLGIFLLSDSPPLQQLVAEATTSIMSTMPKDMRPCQVEPANFHMTIFMTSQPSDPRVDPFVPGGGIDSTQPLAVIPAPSADIIGKELHAWQDLASATQAPDFEVHSLVFASSGTLLLCFVDMSARLLALRVGARALFPGAAEKQSSIMHMTLGRVLDGRNLSLSEVMAIQTSCKQWTQRLRGQKFTPSFLWWVQEFTFTTVQGKRQPLQFQHDTGRFV